MLFFLVRVGCTSHCFVQIVSTSLKIFLGTSSLDWKLRYLIYILLYKVGIFSNILYLFNLLFVNKLNYYHIPFHTSNKS